MLGCGRPSGRARIGTGKLKPTSQVNQVAVVLRGERGLELSLLGRARDDAVAVVLRGERGLEH